MLIYFVRHGEDKDDNLTNFGKKQVKMLSKSLQKFEFENIYSSPYKRCLQTAQILNKKIGKEIIVDTRIQERFKMHHPHTQKDIEWYNNYLNKNFVCEDLETCKDFLKRNADFLDDIISQNKPDSNILVVGHSACLYAFLNYFYKSKKKEVVWNSMSNASCIRFEVKKAPDKINNF